ncbi:MAG: transcriptional regulator, Crp/Fnr family, partial [Cyanobacteriota bacterium]
MTINIPSSKQIDELVNDVDFFREIPKELLLEIISCVSLQKYPCSQSILFDNHCDGSIYFIADGWIRVCTSGEKYKNNIYSIYGVGEILGAIAAVEENWRPIEALTLTTARVWSIRAKDFTTLLKRHPQSGVQVAIFASKRLRKLNQYVRIQEAESTVKVANVLL